MSRMTTSEEAVQSDRQHTSPCCDCPFARAAIKGWLGGYTIRQRLAVAHTDTVSSCHVVENQQCAGLAIYRANVCKQARGEMLKLPADKKKCFSNPMEFEAHHTLPEAADMKKKPKKHQPPQPSLEDKIETAIREAVARVEGIEDASEEHYLDSYLSALEVVKFGLVMRQQELDDDNE